MPSPASTVATRERELFAGLMRPSTTAAWTTLNFKTLARVNDDGPIHIVLDPYRGGFIASCVHELAHRVWQKRLAAWGTAEESLVVAQEEEVMAYIDRHPQLVRKWRKAIAAKLAKDEEVE